MFRRNFIKQFGKEGLEEGVKYEVHHVFPVKFADKFKAAGVDINDPKHGDWWVKETHRKNAKKYNDKWKKFWDDHPNGATKEEIYQLGRDLMNDKDFDFVIKYE